VLVFIYQSNCGRHCALANPISDHSSLNPALSPSSSPALSPALAPDLTPNALFIDPPILSQAPLPSTFGVPSSAPNTPSFGQVVSNNSNYNSDVDGEIMSALTNAPESTEKLEFYLYYWTASLRWGVACGKLIADAKICCFSNETAEIEPFLDASTIPTYSPSMDGNQMSLVLVSNVSSEIASTSYSILDSMPVAARIPVGSMSPTGLPTPRPTKLRVPTKRPTPQPFGRGHFPSSNQLQGRVSSLLSCQVLHPPSQYCRPMKGRRNLHR
jgi:hypothetical protein